MATDNSDKNEAGTKCLTTAQLIEQRAAYSEYKTEVESGGEEALDFGPWLNSKGLRQC